MFEVVRLREYGIGVARSVSNSYMYNLGTDPNVQNYRVDVHRRGATQRYVLVGSCLSAVQLAA